MMKMENGPAVSEVLRRAGTGADRGFAHMPAACVSASDRLLGFGRGVRADLHVLRHEIHQGRPVLKMQKRG